MNEINMVPFIDVMLVLLIIFMVTAPLIAPSVIDLPSVGKAAKQPDKVVQIVIGKDEALDLKVLDKTSRTTLKDVAAAVKSTITRPIHCQIDQRPYRRFRVFGGICSAKTAPLRSKVATTRRGSGAVNSGAEPRDGESEGLRAWPGSRSAVSTNERPSSATAVAQPLPSHHRY